MQTTKVKISEIVYWTLLFILSFSMIVYGLAKPIQFQDFGTSTSTHVSEGHKVMWTFYSYSMGYPIIIGLFEVMGGLALLFSRTRLFGLLLLSILLLNIILQDYFYDILAIKAAIYYQLLALVLLAYDYKKLQIIVRTMFTATQKKPKWLYLAIAFVLAIVLKYIETKI